LATDTPPQRAWRAACPNCGAPVDFRSAASAFAVCGFCKSTVLREGDALRKVGESAELFDDHTPLQLGAAGRAAGVGFTLVGRLQYRHAQGTWNEWHALFDGGRSGWLSEDNGAHVLAFDAPLHGSVPAATSLRAGASIVVEGQAWSVASVAAAKLIAAQGELPHAPNLERGFVVVDLRNTRGEVGTLDYSDPQAPRWSVGKAVDLTELAMTGLSDAAAEKKLKGRSLACPSCGAAIELKLTTTQSVACPQCHAVVDVSQGIGGELAHYAQVNGSEPQIPLGSMGTLALAGGALLPWQVVGYVERCEVAEAEADDDEQVFWREYLLYHRHKGFAFLVDADDGWSWVAPITGVPEPAGDGVRLDGTLYRKLYDYRAKVTWVLGEFYWPLQREQTTFNTDYRGSVSARDKRLNREQSGDEVVWSAGATLAADTVGKAFRLAPEQGAALRRDARPTSDNAASLLARLFFAGFVVVLALVMFRCDDDDACDTLRSQYGAASREYQSCLTSQRSGSGVRIGGGSFGGYSSGGSHK
jgi:predicted RNA-binding Zn-ribbon protein involved in translation (DUF1610 family)